MFRRVALFAFALLASSVTAALAQSPAATRVTFADLGYRDEITLNGSYPSFVVNLPAFRTLRSATLELRAHVSPLAIGRSSIQVLVDKVPVYGQYVSQIGHDPVIRVPIPPLALANKQTIEISVQGYLSVTGDVCYDAQTNGLWLTIDPDSSVDVQTGTPAGGYQIADFFNGYGNRITVVDPHADDALGIVALPYQLRRVESWHQPEVVLADRPASNGRSIVVRAGGTAIDASGTTLSLAPAAIPMADPSVAQLFVTSATDPSPLDAVPPAPPRDRRVALAELGIGTQTVTGYGAISFPEIPLSAARMTGMPDHLQFHIGLVHTPPPGNADATLQVRWNGALIFARRLSSDQNDAFVVDVPRAALSENNTIKLNVISGDAGSCRGGQPFTMTLLGGSYFSWGSVRRDPGSIADFLKSANGKVVVLLGSDTMVPEAFHLMGELATLNSEIHTIDVARFDGHIPHGYDYAIVLTPPDKLAGLDLPLHLDTRSFRIVNPLTGQTVFEAAYRTPIGVMETARIDGTPALLVSNWNDAQATGQLQAFSADVLARQIGNVALFNTAIATYAVGEKLAVYYVEGSPLENFWAAFRLPVIIILAALVVLVALYASRRLAKRRPD
jgi:hypothetical protein